MSSVGYVPDSFGHPAQLPQLFAGFGIHHFVHWRGNGNEIDDIGTAYRWVAPDGSAVRATLLREGYFNAACLPEDPDEAARRLAELARRLDEGGDRPVLLLNGFDHMLPDAHTSARWRTRWPGTRARRSRAVCSRTRSSRRRTRCRPCAATCWARASPTCCPACGRRALDVKLDARRCERLLEGWAEPWAALARRLDRRPALDERPALGVAWRLLLQCQAHDSLCGCSIDAVMDQVTARLARAEELARQTTARLLGAWPGLGVERRTPWTAEQEIAVFNPSPHARTDVVRVPLDPHPALRMTVGMPELPPLLVALANAPRVTRRWPAGARRRVRRSQPPRAGCPACGRSTSRSSCGTFPHSACAGFVSIPVAGADDEVDDGRVVETAEARVAVGDDGTLDVRLGDATYRGLLAVEDRGDRGDTYDFDPVDDDPGAG